LKEKWNGKKTKTKKDLEKKKKRFEYFDPVQYEWNIPE
jgi:hypothetical protein